MEFETMSFVSCVVTCDGCMEHVPASKETEPTLPVFAVASVAGQGTLVWLFLGYWNMFLTGKCLNLLIVMSLKLHALS